MLKIFKLCYTFRMATYFQGNSKHPQHVSVGAILVNDKKEVCCHHFFTKDLNGYWKDCGLDDFYLLMRETVKPNEALEHAVHRGLMEEFGATGEIVDYVGSMQARFTHEEIEVEKTTLYFLCRFIDQDLSRRNKEDIEGETLLEWRTAEYLIPLMKVQAEKFDREDVDESGILERVKLIGYL
jgi:hypothetical protein